MYLGGHGARPPTVGQMPPLELIQEVERRGSQNSKSERENDYLERVQLANGDQNLKSQNVTWSDSPVGSKPTAGKLLQRRPSIGGKQSRRSMLDLNPDEKTSTIQGDQESIAGSVTSSSVQRSRSNSLYDPKSIRLTRRRKSTPVAEDVPEISSLADQFEMLKSCRYLRSRNSIQDEDCDLSNAFG